MITEAAAMREERWRRFSIPDLLVMMPAYAMGFAEVRFQQLECLASPERPPPWPAHAGIFELFCIGFVWGSAFAGPVVLACQCVFRHRRTRLGTGEWLWLSPTVLGLSTWAVSETLYSVWGWATPIWFMLSALVACICSLLAAVMLPLRLLGEHRAVPCLWTDLFGSITCLLTGALLLYSLIVDPLSI